MPLTTTEYDNGGDLTAYTDSLIATKASRVADFDTLSFQEKAAHSSAAARSGTSARVPPATTRTTAGSSSGGFTFSNMLLPPGAEGPAHTHHDVEEAFFVLEGEVKVGIHRGPDEAEYRTLGYRDMIVVPAR